MGGLVHRNEFEVDKELLVKPSVEEILFLETSKSFLVKGVFEMFQLVMISQVSSTMTKEQEQVQYSLSMQTEES